MTTAVLEPIIEMYADKAYLINYLKKDTTMNKADMVARVAEKNDTSKAAAELLLKSVFDVLIEGIKSKERIEVQGLGIFTVELAPERKGRNPQTGEEMIIAPKNRVKFKPAKTLREGVL